MQGLLTARCLMCYLDDGSCCHQDVYVCGGAGRGREGRQDIKECLWVSQAGLP